MKKAIAMLALGFFAFSNLQAQVGDSVTTTTTTTTKKMNYYYYPDANVYYNDANKSYSYYDEGTKTWITNPQLPTTIVITKTAEKVPIMYNGTTIWTDNATHQRKYRKAMKKLSKAQ